MSSLNKAQIIGRLGKDPEVRYAPSGTAIANFTVATSRSWKDKTSGEKVEETEWHRMVAYDRLAEVVGEYLKKGSLAYFEGRLKTRKWQDKDGADRYTTEIIVDQMQMLGSREQGTEGADQGAGRNRPQPPSPRTQSSAPAQRQQPAQRPATAFDDMDDDIPF